jgi:hypothetical protein
MRGNFPVQGRGAPPTAPGTCQHCAPFAARSAHLRRAPPTAHSSTCRHWASHARQVPRNGGSRRQLRTALIGTGHHMRAKFLPAPAARTANCARHLWALYTTMRGNKLPVMAAPRPTTIAGTAHHMRARRFPRKGGAHRQLRTALIGTAHHSR